MAFFKSPDVEGAGVSKNEVKKRGIFEFFILFRRYYGKLLSAGLMKTLFSILIIPSGLGEVGCAKIARCCARDTHSFSTDFSEAVSKNWKQALPMGIINNLLICLFSFMTYFLFQENNVNKGADTVSFIMLALAFSGLMIAHFISYYSPAVLLTFNVTLGQLYKNSFLLAFGGFKRNFIIFFSKIIVLALVFSPMLFDIYVGFGIGVCLWLLIYPAFSALVTQYNIFPVMLKYLIEPFMKSNPGEGQETLRELGLIKSDDSEAVMKDEIE